MDKPPMAYTNRIVNLVTDRKDRDRAPSGIEI